MDDNAVYVDAKARILKLMRQTLGANFKGYYNGDPIRIPETNLPCVIVEKPKTRVRLGATTQDVLGIQLRIKLVFNKREDFGAKDDVDLTEQKLERYMEGRHPVTGDYLDSTVLSALRSHLTLGGLSINTDVDIDYDLQPRPNRQITSEARANIVVTEKIIRGPERMTI
jgi:hypothetical protein